MFAAARALQASDRPVYLSAACGGNEALRPEVESLLASDERAESFLEGQTPVPPVLPQRFQQFDRLRS